MPLLPEPQSAARNDNVELGGVDHQLSVSPTATSSAEITQSNWPGQLRCRSIVAAPVSPAQQKLQLQLHTTGTYGVKAGKDARLSNDFYRGEYTKVQHRLFQSFERRLLWKPWLSGPAGRWTQFLIIVLVVICHKILVSRASHDGNSLLSALGPPFIAIVSAKLMLSIARQEMRRAANQPSQNARTTHHRRSIQFQVALIVMVLAPLISIPIIPTATYIETFKPNGDWAQRCFDFGTVVDYLQAQIPETVHNEDNFPSPKDPSRGFASWLSSIDTAHQPLVPESKYRLALGFDLEEGRKDRDTWAWGRANASHILYEPFFPPDVLPRHSISVGWRTAASKRSQEALTGSLHCSQIDVPTASLNTTDSHTLINLDVMDADGCGASLSLSVEPISTSQRSNLLKFIEHYQDFIASAIKEVDADAYLREKATFFQPRLTQYSAALKSSKPLTIIRPQWRPAINQTETRASCAHKFILGISPDPFAAVDASVHTMNIQAASCSTEYKVLAYGLESVQQRLKTPFHRQSPHDREPQFASIVTNDTHFTRGWNDWRFHNTDVLGPKIDEAVRHQLSLVDAFESWNPSRLIEYEFLANQGLDRSFYHSIAYAADEFMSNIFYRLATAAEMVPRKCRNWKDHPIAMKQSYTGFEERILQNQRWFRIFLWLTTYALIYCTIVSHVDADDTASGLPWETNSIAARAALLCRSRLPKFLSSQGRLPWDIITLDPVRIGNWAHSDEGAPYFWRADSMLQDFDEQPPTRSTTFWHRFSFQSLPAHTHPLIVTGIGVLLLAVVSLTYSFAHKLREALDDTPKSGSPLLPILLGPHWSPPRNFKHSLILQIIPASTSVGLTVYWWDALTLFYKMRLPWAELFHPNVASKTLTLDYLTPTLPIWKALRNKHWMLSALIVGNLLVLPLPFFAGHVFDFRWTQRSGEVGMAEQSLTWQHHSIETTDFTVMGPVLQQAFASQKNASALPKWTSYREALMPIDVKSMDSTDDSGSLPQGWARHWSLESSTIRAALQCNIMTSEPIVGAGRTSHQNQKPPPQALKIDLRGIGLTYDDSDYLVTSPCFGQDPGRELQSDMFCSHWELKSLISAENATVTPAWIISAIHFEIDSHNSHDTVQSSHALVCQPIISTGTGETKLLSMNGNIEDAFVHSHRSVQDKALDSSLAWQYSQLLNHSVFSADAWRNDWSTTDPSRKLFLRSPAISTPHFRGDLLSFLTYRDMFKNQISLDDPKILSEVSSLAFSTIFSIAAQSTNLFKVPQAVTKVPVTELLWREELTYNTTVVGLVLAGVIVLLLTMLSHVAIMMLTKRYLFPIAPEPIENAWFFLCRSSVVKIIEKKIARPENLSLRDFHAQVQSLGYNYVFGKEAEGTNWIDAKVDVVEEFHRQDRTTMVARQNGSTVSQSVEAGAEAEASLLGAQNEAAQPAVAR